MSAAQEQGRQKRSLENNSKEKIDVVKSSRRTVKPNIKYADLALHSPNPATKVGADSSRSAVVDDSSDECESEDFETPVRCKQPKNVIVKTTSAAASEKPVLPRSSQNVGDSINTDRALEVDFNPERYSPADEAGNESDTSEVTISSGVNDLEANENLSSSPHKDSVSAGEQNEDDISLEAMHAMLGIGDKANMEPQKGVLKSVKLDLKVVSSCLNKGDPPKYFIIVTDNNYHLRDIFTQKEPLEIGGNEMFAVFCKYLFRSTLTDGFRARNAKLEEQQAQARVMVPPSLMLKPKANGYIVGFSFNQAVIEKAVNQVKKLCETRGIPSDAKYHAGERVEVITTRYQLNKMNDVLAMDVIVHMLNSF